MPSILLAPSVTPTLVNLGCFMRTELQHQLTPEWHHKWNRRGTWLYWLGQSATPIAVLLAVTREHLGLSRWWVAVAGGISAVSCILWIATFHYQMRRMQAASDELRQRYSELYDDCEQP